jgi:hypothetical protein
MGEEIWKVGHFFEFQRPVSMPVFIFYNLVLLFSVDFGYLLAAIPKF